MIEETKPSAEETADEAQAALRDGIERARELLCEAKLAIAQPETLKAEPPILRS